MKVRCLHVYISIERKKRAGTDEGCLIQLNEKKKKKSVFPVRPILGQN